MCSKFLRHVGGTDWRTISLNTFFLIIYLTTVVLLSLEFPSLQGVSFVFNLSSHSGKYFTDEVVGTNTKKSERATESVDAHSFCFYRLSGPAVHL